MCNKKVTVFFVMLGYLAMVCGSNISEDFLSFENIAFLDLPDWGFSEEDRQELLLHSFQESFVQDLEFQESTKDGSEVGLGTVRYNPYLKKGKMDESSLQDSSTEVVSTQYFEQPCKYSDTKNIVVSSREQEISENRLSIVTNSVDSFGGVMSISGILNQDYLSSKEGEGLLASLLLQKKDAPPVVSSSWNPRPFVPRSKGSARDQQCPICSRWFYKQGIAKHLPTHEKRKTTVKT